MSEYITRERALEILNDIGGKLYCGLGRGDKRGVRSDTERASR